jgi:hypothetical protein
VCLTQGKALNPGPKGESIFLEYKMGGVELVVEERPSWSLGS